VNGQLAPRLTQDAAQPGIQVQFLGGKVELLLRDVPWVDRRAQVARWSSKCRSSSWRAAIRK
jgi:hypothetical protein